MQLVLSVAMASANRGGRGGPPAPDLAFPAGLLPELVRSGVGADGIAAEAIAEAVAAAKDAVASEGAIAPDALREFFQRLHGRLCRLMEDAEGAEGARDDRIVEPEPPAVEQPLARTDPRAGLGSAGPGQPDDVYSAYRMARSSNYHRGIVDYKASLTKSEKAARHEDARIRNRRSSGPR